MEVHGGRFSGRCHEDPIGAEVELRDAHDNGRHLLWPSWLGRDEYEKVAADEEHRREDTARRIGAVKACKRRLALDVCDGHLGGVSRPGGEHASLTDTFFVNLQNARTSEARRGPEGVALGGVIVRHAGPTRGRDKSGPYAPRAIASLGLLPSTIRKSVRERGLLSCVRAYNPCTSAKSSVISPSCHAGVCSNRSCRCCSQWSCSGSSRWWV